MDRDWAAAIFLVHPIQTEPVLYVYQRSSRRLFLLATGIDSAFEGSQMDGTIVFSLCLRRKRIGPGRSLTVAVLGAARVRQRGASEDDRRPAFLDHRYSIGLIIGALRRWLL